ncbi:formate dehydrogenase [Piscinibacter sp.]|uniref:formate dehydrogenase n=1 Tax=Piscinibacter sp. TaxID=1903157 RepID=UPI003559C122
MKSSAFDQAKPLKRRGLLLGAGVAGVAALAVKSLPVAPTEATPAAVKPAADSAGGYQLTQHVLRYYETAKV